MAKALIILTLLIKLIIIIITLIVVPLYYLGYRIYMFSVIMSPTFLVTRKHTAVDFCLYFFLNKVLFVVHITSVLMFLVAYELFALAILIETGIVY